MAILTQAFNTLRSTVRPAMRWASQAQGVRIAGRLAYAPKLGAIGAGVGAVAGSVSVFPGKDAAYARNHKNNFGVLKGAALGALLGTRIMPRLYSGGRALGSGARNVHGLLTSGR